MTATTLRERYQELEWPQQLGNLASTLARISTRASSPQYDALVKDLFREAALFIEWSAPHLPADLLVDMAAKQRELLAWWHVWPLDQTRSLLVLYARNTSDRLLHMAGLVRQPWVHLPLIPKHSGLDRCYSGPGYTA